MSGLAPGVHAGLPSGTLTMIVAFDDPLDVSDGHRIGHRDAYWAMISGLHSRPAMVHHPGRQHGVQLGITPRGTDALFNTSAGALARTTEHLGAVAPTFASELVDPVFAAPSEATRPDAILATYAYAIQIYADFSGYTDIAIGIALLLGFDFPKNFDSPYRSLSITEFWRRWHMTLSRWLRDYLYIPLGGNRKGKLLTYRNLFITMLLGGLWHGASWTFVIWGTLHGAFLAVHRIARGGQVPTGPVSFRQIPSVLATFGDLRPSAEGTLGVGLTDGPAAVSGVVRTLDEAGITVKNLELREPSLDDVFAEATGYRLEGADG